MVQPASDAGVGKQAPFLRKTFELASVGGQGAPRYHRARALPLLHQRPAGGRRPAHARLDLLRQAARLSDLRCRPSTLKPGSNQIDIWLARRLVSLAADVDQSAARQHLGRCFRRPWPRSENSPTPTRRVILKTDATWRSGLLPILKSGIYFGEIYDARLEGAAASEGSASCSPSTSPCSFRKRRRRCASSRRSPCALVAGRGRPDDLRFRPERRRLCRILRQRRGRRAGHRRARGDSRQARRRSTKRASGPPSRTSSTSSKAAASESYRPIFTFQGFRYRARDDRRAAPRSRRSPTCRSARRCSRPATFTSGHALVNRLVQNTIWSQRSNFIDVPTDCPQRDERLGWTGDAQVFAADRLLSPRQRKIPAQMAARRDGRSARGRRHRACRSRSDASSSGDLCEFRRQHRLGRRHLRRAVDALAALRRSKRSRGDAAGDGEVGRLSSGASATARSSGRRGIVTSAASRSAIGCSRAGRPKSRCRPAATTWPRRSISTSRRS